LADVPDTPWARAPVLAFLSLLPAFGGCESSSTAPPAVASVAVTAPANTLEQGTTMQLQALVLPSDAPEGVTWWSSSSAVASVGPSRLVC
jgi:hypothetical protein